MKAEEKTRARLGGKKLQGPTFHVPGKLREVRGGRGKLIVDVRENYRNRKSPGSKQKVVSVYVGSGT